MAENDFLSGLLGGVKDVGGSIYGGISGLLGGGEQAPAGANQMQDSLSMLSPQDQRRLMFSTLGQVGATLLAAGARQSPESRAQALAQLGKVGPAIEESIQRSAALQQQRIAAQRQNELFPIQLAAAKAGLAQQNISQATNMLALQNQETALQRQITQAEQFGLSDQANTLRGQLSRLQQITKSLPPIGGVPASSIAPSAQPMDTAVAAPAAAPVPAPAAASVPAPAAAPAAAPMTAASTAQPTQMLQQQFPYVPVNRALSELNTGTDIAVSLQKLMDLNEKNKSEQMRAEGDLRKEFNPKAERYNAVQTAYSALPSLKDLKNGVADHALVLSYYKIFDPNSVVSTTETGQIASATGIVSRLGEQAANRLISGEQLTPEQRTNLYNAAKAKFDREYDSYERAFNQARETAKEFVDPNRAIPDVRDPQIVASVARERDIADISRKITPNDVLTLGLEDLGNLDQSKMSKPARDAAKARLDMLMKAAMVPPPVATTEQPQRGYGLGQNPLRGAMQNYPRGLLREDQLPPVGY